MAILKNSIFRLMIITENLVILHISALNMQPAIVPWVKQLSTPKCVYSFDKYYGEAIQWQVLCLALQSLRLIKQCSHP